MNIYTPYTYLIGWSDFKVYYYGVRFAKNCHPDDLWKTYFTSSKQVKKFREKHGEPDIIQIRKKFQCPEKAKLWEGNVLKKMKVKDRSDFLNITDTNNIVSQAMSDGLKKHWSSMTPQEKRNRSKNAVIAMQKKAKLPEIRKKISRATKNRMNNMDEKEKEIHFKRMRDGLRRYNEQFSAEEKSHRAKELVAMRKKTTCPYCSKTGSTGNMNRWHFNNCKFKN